MTSFPRFGLWLCLLALSFGLGRSTFAAPAPPNIVLMLADDLGAMDLGCQGGDLVETPHLDQLATEGVRFTRAYAMSVCSPTRAALMTGKHAARVHVTIWAEGSLKGPTNRKLLQGDSLHDLPHEEVTLAESLKAAGYVTLHVGKWHLGGGAHSPETQGFDVNIGGTHWGAPTTFFWPFSGAGRFGPEFRYVPGLGLGKPGDFLTDRLTDEALRLIDDAGERPFFLNLWFHNPHTPIEAKAEDVKHFEKKLRPGLNHSNAVYAAMVKNLDENVGRVLAHLKKRGLEKNTIVLFTSDNGGYIGTDKRSGQSVPVTSNAPLRSGKGSLYEGGVRVPLIVRWPGVTPRGATCAEPVVVMDLFRTLRAAGAPASGPARASSTLDQLASSESGAPADGLDLTPLLKNPAGKLDRDALFFHYPHYYETTTPVSAVRQGQWKLLEYLEDNRVELFDLVADPAEKSDLAAQQPERARELRQRLHAWRDSVDAAMPRPNAEFKPKR